MAFTTWTCTICSLLIVVEDGPAHLGSDSHKARLAQYNAEILVSRLKELFSKEESILPISTHTMKDQQCGITGASVSTEGTCTFTHTAESSRYLASAIPLTLQRTTVEPTQTKAKLRDDVTVPAPASAVTWTCTLCDRKMQEISKVDHLAGKSHTRKLISKSPDGPLGPLHVNSSILGWTSEASKKTKEKKIAKSNSPASRLLQSWTCLSCNVVLTFRQKASHSCCSSSDSKPSTTDGPLDKFFQFYPSFRYDASTPPAISFESLQNHLQKRHNWTRKSLECKELWQCYQTALTQEFNLWFGVEDDLDAWHSLCRAVRITPLPTTCELCRSVGLPPLSFKCVSTNP